jgi:hypothetical protein
MMSQHQGASKIGLAQSRNIELRWQPPTNGVAQQSVIVCFTGFEWTTSVMVYTVIDCIAASTLYLLIV